MGHSVTIDRFEYVETVTMEVESPLGGALVTEAPCDHLRATISAGPVVGHWLYFKPEAIADRMQGYELADELVAIESLVRELVFSWAAELEPADPTDRRHVNGGQDKRITVKWSPAARLAVAAVLPPHLPRIHEAHRRARELAAPPPVIESEE
jgi:hypothetical protein